jgi:hypothetical protein
MEHAPHVDGWGALGVDLAAQPEHTAACLIDVDDAAGRARAVELGDAPMDDAHLLDLMRHPAVRKIGIDAPLGWPDEFVRAVAAYGAAGAWPVALGDDAAQARLTLRETDRVVWKLVGRRPLSVSTDRIAYPAMRAARLLAHLGEPVDRSGHGRVAEVYPAAALRRWGLDPAASETDRGSYKGRSPAATSRRRTLADRLVAETAGWLHLGDEHLQRCCANDDQLDALVSALVAVALERGQAEPAPVDLARARREGWIWLPGPGSLRDLFASPHR